MSEEQQNVEEKAKVQGWNPDYDGPNRKTAEQFLEDGEKIAPVVAERNKKLMEDIASLKQDIKELSDQQFKVIAEAKQKGYNDAMRELEEKQIEAVEEQDVEKFKALEEEKKKLKRPDIKKTNPEQKIDPDFTEWHKENTWYRAGSQDPISIAADAYGGFLVNSRPDLKGKDFYKEVEKHIKTIFPDQFGKPDSKIEIGHSGSKKSKDKTFDNLPPEAQKACKMQEKKFGIKREEYVKEYFAAYGE